MFPILFSKSSKSFDKQNIAMISEATVISKPSSRGKPLATPPRFIFIDLKDLSFISITLFQTILLTSISNLFPQ